MYTCSRLTPTAATQCAAAVEIGRSMHLQYVNRLELGAILVISITVFLHNSTITDYH